MPEGGIQTACHNLVFVELEMKDGQGFFTGQVSQFAIVKDDEPHKPIYLIDVSFKEKRTDTYNPVASDGVLLDLADASHVLVSQTLPEDLP